MKIKFWYTSFSVLIVALACLLFVGFRLIKGYSVREEALLTCNFDLKNNETVSYQTLLNNAIAGKYPYSDGLSYSLDVAALKTESAFQYSTFGFSGKELPATPVIIRSFEKKSWDFEILKDYIFDHVSEPTVLKYNILFNGPSHYYYDKKDDIIRNITPAPFTQQTFDNFYNGQTPQLDFFHTSVQNKTMRGALIDYFFTCYDQLSSSLPESLKKEIIANCNDMLVFLKNYQTNRPKYLEYARNNTMLEKTSTLNAFLYRRIETDKISSLDLITYINNFKDKVTASLNNSTWSFYSKFAINGGDLYLTDSQNKKIKVSTKNSQKTIELDYCDLEIKCMVDNTGTYYQFANRISGGDQTEFIGLYDSNLNLIRGK